MKRFASNSFCCAIAALAALLFSSCDLRADKIKVGLVTDSGGIEDKSFNASAWKGIRDAEKKLEIKGSYIDLGASDDYAAGIQSLISDNCDFIITMGYLQADATAAAATAHPGTKFAIVDYAFDPAYDNVLGIVFAADQAAFLAGYAAAAATKAGAVATYGGKQIEPVALMMDGFALGVRYYNLQHGAAVSVLGWNPDNQTGEFTDSFDSTEDGRLMGEKLFGQGADIIMPVAGLTGLGSAAAAQESSGLYVVGVDTDWTDYAPEYAGVIFTSVLKKIDVAVYDAIEQVVNNAFSGGSYLGALENDGVGITEVHWPDTSAAASMEAELEDIRQDIIAGAVTTRLTKSVK